MSDIATTTGPVVGAAAVSLLAGGLCTSRITPTKATMARNTPINKTRRLERFKSILPDDGVTGGTTLAPPKSAATIPKG